MKANLIHRAIRGPREGHIGEQVYYELWRNFMAIPVDDGFWDGRPRSKLQEVLHNYPWKPDQRCASVCATFICWLGCNNGTSLLHSANRFRSLGLREPLLHAWVENNKRAHGVNHGFRTIEYMLAPEDHFGRRSLLDPPGTQSLLWIPYLRQEDHEAIEHLCIWLGEPSGQRFIALAEGEIRRLKAEEYDAQRILGRKRVGIEADTGYLAVMRERMAQG